MRRSAAAARCGESRLRLRPTGVADEHSVFKREAGAVADGTELPVDSIHAAAARGAGRVEGRSRSPSAAQVATTPCKTEVATSAVHHPPSSVRRQPQLPQKRLMCSMWPVRALQPHTVSPTRQVDRVLLRLLVHGVRLCLRLRSRFASRGCRGVSCLLSCQEPCFPVVEVLQGMNTLVR